VRSPHTALVNRLLCVAALLLAGAAGAFGQATRIVSANEFFAALIAHYAGIKTYEATIGIKQDTAVSTGRLSYKAPNLLNVRFDSPAGEVLNFDGKRLDVTVPSQKVVLEQDYKTVPDDQLAGIATAGALAVLRTQYSVAYLTGPDPVPLDKDTPDLVIKLKLVARASTSFSDMIMSVKDQMVRRVEATLANGASMVVDFTSVKPNAAVPDNRFVFVPPGDYTAVKNWLYDPSKQ